MNKDDIYKELYSFYFNKNNSLPVTGFTLNEIKLRPVYSEVTPLEVDLSSYIGGIKLNLPLISAAMDTVSGSEMAKTLSEVGGCGIIYRHKKPEVQLKWIRDSIDHKFCLVSNPKSLHPDQPLEYAQDILNEFGFSTIPVVYDDNVLAGILFTKDIAFKGHTSEPIKNWMKPFHELKTESIDASYERIKDRLLNEQECSVLPVLDKDKKFKGIYFMKDFFQANPATHNGRPLVGMAVGVHESDLERVSEALKLGVGIIVIDSSHGNCPAVIEQTKKIVKIASGAAAIVAGNIADIDGYIRLAEAGADAVKCGIGSGSICTTSQVTGAGMPMFTLIRELAYARKKLLAKGLYAPVIIPDGGINGPGEMVVALAAGGHICMAGKWLAAAKESLSFKENGVSGGYIYYRGMASKESIEKRLSDRYGKQKKAPEGVAGGVVYRGPLKSWIGADIELIAGGFSHAGASNIKDLHKLCEHPMAFVRFTSSGEQQINTRIENCF
jgi:IMP dehydrogenase